MKTRMLYRCGGLVGVAALVLLGGCQSGSKQTATSTRPLVGQTAAEAVVVGNGDGAMLVFFDELENRPLAAQDDALHACLLLGTGSSGTTHGQRLAAAKELGYVPETYDRPGREAVTVGEVSQMMVKILTGQRAASEEEAVNVLVQRDVLPGPMGSNQGLTGAQLVSMVGAAQDVMVASGVQRVPLPKMDGPASFVPEAQPQLTHEERAPVPVLGAVNGSTEVAPQAVIPEPVRLNTDSVALDKVGESSKPNVQLQTISVHPVPVAAPAPAPAIGLSDAETAKPVIIGPGGQAVGAAPVPTPVQPVVAEPKPVPTSDAAKKQGNWVSGQKLKKSDAAK